MPETLGSVATYFAGTAGAATAADASAAALDASVAGSGVLTGANVAAGGSIGFESGSLTAIGTSAATAAASAATTRLLSPKPPGPLPIAAMPDPLAEEQAKQQSIIEQLARRGRASTVLTQPASGGTLGG